MSNNFNESQDQSDLLQHLESIEEVLSRNHKPYEVQGEINELMAAMESGDLTVKRRIEIALLDQARNRVKYLLAHPDLQADHHEHTRLKLEKIQSMLHPLQALASMYQYSPHPESIQQIDLGINWKSVEVAANNSDFRHFDSIDENDADATHRESPAAKFIEKSLFQTAVDCSQSSPLKLEGHKMIREDKTKGSREEFFILRMNNPNFSEEDFSHFYVGNFVFKKNESNNHTTWNMGDRIVSEAYRNQGIAPKMLEMTEGMIKQYGQEINKPQLMEAEVGQVNVLLWLLKQGYVPENEQDKEKIEKLFNGDETLMLASAPDDSEKEEKRQWYIFEKRTLLDNDGKQKTEVWDGNNYGKPIHYMKSSFRIKLKKEL